MINLIRDVPWAGDKVKIRTKDGRKAKGLVTNVDIQTEPYGPPGSQIGGPSTIVMTITLDLS